MDFLELYKTNSDFKKYVDRYSLSHIIPVWDALEHAIVKEVGKEYAAIQ